jgi:hypothetical protein
VRLPGASIAPISRTCACCQTRSENNGAKALNRETNNQGKGVNTTTSGGQSQISPTTFINGQSRDKVNPLKWQFDNRQTMKRLQNARFLRYKNIDKRDSILAKPVESLSHPEHAAPMGLNLFAAIVHPHVARVHELVAQSSEGNQDSKEA